MHRSPFISIGCTLAVFLLTSLALVGQSGASKTKEATKKIVFLTGDDLNHASGTHEFYAGGLLLKNALEQSEVGDSVEVTVVNNWPEDASVFSDAAVIVHYYKGNQAHFLNQNHEFIEELADQGVGQVFIHYAVDPDTSINAVMKKITGGVYKDKFSANPHWPLKANLENHPINQGLSTYEILDEWYFNMDFEGEVKTGFEAPDEIDQVYSVMNGNTSELRKAKRLKGPLKKKQFTPGELTVIWAKEGSNGCRGAGVTGGHYHKNWADDSFRKQVLNAIAWCAQLPVPSEGISSPPIDEETINLNLDSRKKGGLKKITL